MSIGSVTATETKTVLELIPTNLRGIQNKSKYQPEIEDFVISGLCSVDFILSLVIVTLSGTGSAKQQ